MRPMLYDSLQEAVDKALPGDTIVLGMGSHYVPHPLVVAKCLRIISAGCRGMGFAGIDAVIRHDAEQQAAAAAASAAAGGAGGAGAGAGGKKHANANANSMEDTNIWLQAHALSATGGASTSTSGAALANSMTAVEEQWVCDPSFNGEWYPSLADCPPLIAKKLGYNSAWRPDQMIHKQGAALTTDTTVADSAVVRINGPLIWCVAQTAKVPLVTAGPSTMTTTTASALPAAGGLSGSVDIAQAALTGQSSKRKSTATTAAAAAVAVSAAAAASTTTVVDPNAPPYPTAMALEAAANSKATRGQDLLDAAAAMQSAFSAGAEFAAITRGGSSENFASLAAMGTLPFSQAVVPYATQLQNIISSMAAQAVLATYRASPEIFADQVKITADSPWGAYSSWLSNSFDNLTDPEQRASLAPYSPAFWTLATAKVMAAMGLGVAEPTTATTSASSSSPSPSLTPFLPAIPQSGIDVVMPRGGGGQLRGLTLRNVKNSIAHCLIVCGNGPLVLASGLGDSDNGGKGAPAAGAATDGIAIKPDPSQQQRPAAQAGSASADVVIAAPLLSRASSAFSSSSSPTAPGNPLAYPVVPKPRLTVTLPPPLEVAQVDISNRGGSGAAVLVTNSAHASFIACRIGSGSGSGVLLSQGGFATLVHSSITDCGGSGITITSGSAACIAHTNITGCAGSGVRMRTAPLALADVYFKQQQQQQQDDDNEEASSSSYPSVVLPEDAALSSLVTPAGSSPLTTTTTAKRSAKIYTLPPILVAKHSKIKKNGGSSVDIPPPPPPTAPVAQSRQGQVQVQDQDQDQPVFFVMDCKMDAGKTPIFDSDAGAVVSSASASASAASSANAAAGSGSTGGRRKGGKQQQSSSSSGGGEDDAFSSGDAAPLVSPGAQGQGQGQGVGLDEDLDGGFEVNESAAASGLKRSFSKMMNGGNGNGNGSKKKRRIAGSALVFDATATSTPAQTARDDNDEEEDDEEVEGVASDGGKKTLSALESLPLLSPYFAVELDVNGAADPAASFAPPAAKRRRLLSAEGEGASVSASVAAVLKHNRSTPLPTPSQLRNTMSGGAGAGGNAGGSSGAPGSPSRAGAASGAAPGALRKRVLLHETKEGSLVYLLHPSKRKLVVNGQQAGQQQEIAFEPLNTVVSSLPPDMSFEEAHAAALEARDSGSPAATYHALFPVPRGSLDLPSTLKALEASFPQGRSKVFAVFKKERLGGLASVYSHRHPQSFATVQSTLMTHDALTLDLIKEGSGGWDPFDEANNQPQGKKKKSSSSSSSAAVVAISDPYAKLEAEEEEEEEGAAGAGNDAGPAPSPQTAALMATDEPEEELAATTTVAPTAAPAAGAGTGAGAATGKGRGRGRPKGSGTVKGGGAAAAATTATASAGSVAGAAAAPAAPAPTPALAPFFSFIAQVFSANEGHALRAQAKLALQQKGQPVPPDNSPLLPQNPPVMTDEAKIKEVFASLPPQKQQEFQLSYRTYCENMQISLQTKTPPNTVVNLRNLAVVQHLTPANYTPEQKLLHEALAKQHPAAAAATKHLALNMLAQRQQTLVAATAAAPATAAPAKK